MTKTRSGRSGTTIPRDAPIGQDAHVLSAKCRNRILFKREDMQPVFSFKIRGAYNKIASLTQEQRDAGIFACSAGCSVPPGVLHINEHGVRGNDSAVLAQAWPCPRPSSGSTGSS